MTNQEKSGLIESAEKKINHYHQIIEKAAEKAGDKILTSKDKAYEYLNYDTKNISRLNNEDILEAVYILNQLAMLLQQEFNKHKALAEYLEYQVKKVTIKQINNYKCYSYEERLLNAITDNEHASVLDSERLKASSIASRLYGLSDKVQQIAKLYNNELFYRRKLNDGQK